MKLRRMSSAKIFPFHTAESFWVRLRWYVNLRWVGIIGILIAVPLGRDIFGFNLAYNPIIIILSILAFLNIIYHLIIQHLPPVSEFSELVFAEVQILTDMLFLSTLIHFAGGINNPLYFLYIVLVILSGILFPGITLPWVNASAAAFLLTTWTVLEFFDFIPSYSLFDQRIELRYFIIALFSFYLINFTGIYILKDFLIRFRHLKRIIDQKNDALENALRERSKIFRYTAHELKSPLTAIHSTLSVVKQLYNRNLPPEGSDMILRAERRTDQVLNMVKEMITITQYNLDIDKRVIEHLEFNEWVKSLVSLQRDYSVKKRVFLKLTEYPRSFYVSIDKSGMEKVLTNLVNNALRYTPEGGYVEVSVFRSDDFFGFTVSDTGIGIAQEDLDKIFKEFYRTKEARKMEQIGTGLGLNMVREIVEKNDGRITVNSELNKGSSFKVELPLPVKTGSYKKIYVH